MGNAASSCITTYMQSYTTRNEDHGLPLEMRVVLTHCAVVDGAPAQAATARLLEGLLALLLQLCAAGLGAGIGGAVIGVTSVCGRKKQ